MLTGCICVTHYEAGFGVIPRILPECPYHRGVHPLQRLGFQRSWWCANGSHGNCPKPCACECHAQIDGDA